LLTRNVLLICGSIGWFREVFKEKQGAPAQKEEARLAVELVGATE